VISPFFGLPPRKLVSQLRISICWDGWCWLFDQLQEDLNPRSKVLRNTKLFWQGVLQSKIHPSPEIRKAPNNKIIIIIKGNDYES
jgi:hypothetical protein